MIETCLICRAPVAVQIHRGSGYCGENCRKAVERVQWFRNGDHPLDYALDLIVEEDGIPVRYTGAYRCTEDWEGDVVRYFRHAEFPGDETHICGHTWHQHGWIDDDSNSGNGQVVCPGRWVIRSGTGYRVEEK